MLKKSIFIVALTILIFLTFSCYTQKIVKVNEMKNNRGKILAVVTKSGDWIELSRPGQIVDDEILYISIKDGKKTVASIPLEEVKRVWLKKFSSKFLLESLIVLTPICFFAYFAIRNASR